jgi:hypothetical protein
MHRVAPVVADGDSASNSNCADSAQWENAQVAADVKAGRSLLSWAPRNIRIL